MRKLLIVALAVIGLAGVFAAGSVTSALAGRASNDDAPTAEAIGGANAQYLRASALVSSGGGVVRSKGVSAVTHPSTGLYCVDPSGSFNVTKVIPNIGVDWSTSLGDALLAQYRSSGVGCPANTIAVLTFDGEDGSFDVSNNVSFTITVP